MPSYVCNGANMRCTFGTGSSSLTILPEKMITEENNPAANIMDFKPLVNIASFGNCMSLMNPVVAVATAKNSGVLEPQACIPAIISPWMPGQPNVLLKNMPALMDFCINTCMWMGIITITSAGETSISTNGPAPDMGAMMAELAAAADAATKEMEDGMEDMIKKVNEEEAKKK